MGSMAYQHLKVISNSIYIIIIIIVIKLFWQHRFHWFFLYIYP